ncbi:unnamed protein product [Mesocestoides corti]|nr:unnamed protein product [Mesocestoides corti]
MCQSHTNNCGFLLRVPFIEKSISLLASHLPGKLCKCFLGYNPVVTLKPFQSLWAPLLCLFGHLCLLIMQTFYPTDSTFFTALDVMLALISASLVVTNQSLRLFIAPSPFGLGVAIAASFLLLVWLLYSKDIFLRHQWKSTTPWSVASTPAARPPSSPLASVASLPSSSEDFLAQWIPIDKLSLKPSVSTPSCQNPPSYYSAIFSPSTLTTSVVAGHQKYACTPSAMSAYSALNPGPPATQQYEEDMMSHFTSVSQLGFQQRKTKRQRRKQKRPVGFIRWLLCLLFGPLDTWADVRAEIFCLSYAVFITVLLILVYNFFLLLYRFLAFV